LNANRRVASFFPGDDRKDRAVNTPTGLPTSKAGTSNLFRHAKFMIGDVVKHRVFPFRGVVFDVDPVFDNTEEWLASIPEDVRPHRDQPFYHLLAENAETTYVAYVSEQNLLADESGAPCRHPLLREMFMSPKRGVYRIKGMRTN